MPSRDTLRLLYADDEPHLQELMRMELPRMGHEVTVCPDGRTALAALDRGTYDAAILDLRMPGLGGLEVMQQIKQLSPQTEAIVLTGHATLDTAVEALRLGAFDYLTKPCKLVELESVLKRIAEKRALVNRAVALETRLKAAEGTTEIVGQTPIMQRVKQLIATVAPTDSTVLVLGQTGTGKELVARNLHELSTRDEMPFVAVNCGALPENLVESELFGHRKGAFTGADQNRKGLFEVADGGTLFLDEVGELPAAIQVKLLRFLESGEIRRVGDNDPFHVDVRVLCATNRDLAQMVQKGDFREDLYFRINTFEIPMPSLRERRDDIPLLARHLLSRIAGKLGQRHAAANANGNAALISHSALETLRAYDWPGNVRELANVLEHAAILSRGAAIEPEHLPQQLATRRLKGPHFHLAGGRTLREIELDVIQEVLSKHDGNKPTAARELGISLKTLYNKLNQMQDA
jgi:DNA-binding NtrC family response regulator